MSLPINKFEIVNFKDFDIIITNTRDKNLPQVLNI